MRARRNRDNERLNSGVVTNPKDLEGLQHELVALDRRIRSLEDSELEIMDALETAEAELAAADEELETINGELAEKTAERDKNLAEIDAEAQSELDERSRLVDDVPDDLLALYQKLRDHHGGTGAGLLRRKQCEGCRLEITGADLSDIAASDPDDVVRCPECSRILVRTDESGL